MTKLIPNKEWLLVYPVVQDERKLDSGIILLAGTKTDEIDMLRCVVTEVNPLDETAQEFIRKDAVVLIPKMDGLNLSIDNKNYKLVKMDRVIAIEIDMDEIERQKDEMIMQLIGDKDNE